jgi:hypothetical protein
MLRPLPWLRKMALSSIAAKFSLERLVVTASLGVSKGRMRPSHLPI